MVTSTGPGTYSWTGPPGVVTAGAGAAASREREVELPCLGDGSRGVVSADLREVDVPVGVDAKDPRPGPEPVSANNNDRSLDDLLGVSGVSQQAPIQAVVILIVEVRS
jgi:hypothetical protein